MNQGPFVRSEMTECLNACWKKKISLRCGTARFAGRKAGGRVDGRRDGRVSFEAILDLSTLAQRVGRMGARSFKEDSEEDGGGAMMMMMIMMVMTMMSLPSGAKVGLLCFLNLVVGERAMATAPVMMA